MGKTDLSALLEEKTKQEAGYSGEGNDNPLLKIETPTNKEGKDFLTIRVLPPYGDNKLPYLIKKTQFFRVDKELFIVNPPAEDPAERLFWKKFRNMKELDDNNPTKVAWKKLEPAKYWYLNVVDRASEEVKILRLTKAGFNHVFDVIAGHAADGVDVTDPENGHDLKLTIERANNFGKPGPRVVGCSTVIKPSPVGIDDWEESLYDLEEWTSSGGEDWTTEQIEDFIPELLGDQHEKVTG